MTFDVLVVGGGPVGACVAALLARGTASEPAPLRVGLLEPKRPPLPEASEAMDLRVVALSRASERILNAAGAWDGIRGPRIAAYERMRVWHESVPPSEALVFDAAEAAEPNLGYIAENRLVQAALLDAAEAAGVNIIPSGLSSLSVGDDYIELDTATEGSRAATREADPSVARDAEGSVLRARLVIGADGAQSAVRAAVGLTAEQSDYGQTAIVAIVATERPHEATAWQRFLRTGTLAFLPLADGTSSIVWSADDALATTLLSASPEDFARELDRASDGALGTTRLVSDRASFPLRKLTAHRYVAHRCALIGDAAHVVHPLAGQGVNLGLLDAAVLAEELIAAHRRNEDAGALGVLRRYERWRKSEVVIMGTAIDAFDRFLAHGTGPVSRLAQRGLSWVNRSQEIKRLFISRALGVSGELPAIARRA
jgi:2-octaprenylphenol hydroxylase